MTVIIRLTLAAIALAATDFSMPPAHAGSYGEAPWCAVINTGTGDVHWDCQYRTVEECVPNVLAGNRGSCGPNPRYVPPPPAYATPNRHRKRHS